MKILVTGDFCSFGRTDSFLRDERYSDLFNDFTKVTADVDYSIVNLECPITFQKQKIEKTGPCLKTENLNILEALKFAGFDLITLANNHIQDYSGDGVLDTIRVLKEKGFNIVGAGKNRFEASKPFLVEFKDVKVGFINISENEFCSASNELPGANTFNLIDNLKSVSELKGRVDKIILIYHGGREHYQLPTPEQRKRFRFFIENGVDAIVAHHTHCVSGFEYYLGKPILYSLGNFLFDYKKKYQKGNWTKGMSVILSLSDKNENFKIELIPHLQGRKEDSTYYLLKGDQKELFLNDIGRISNVIQDDHEFYNQWDNYLKSQEIFYLSSFYIKNILIRALFFKKILPIWLLRSKHNKLILNLMRCEAHHEISNEILNRLK